MKKHILPALLWLAPVVLTGQAITQLGYYTQNGVFALDIKDQYMVLGSGHIVDNSDPSAPTLTGQYSFPGFGSAMLVKGQYCYVGTGMNTSLHIGDITNVSFPLHKSTLDLGLGNGVFGMDVKGNTLYMALGSDGVVCSVDITDKNNPAMLDTLFISGGQCRDIFVEGNHAFAAHDGGLKVLDITDPSALEVLTTVGTGYNSVDAGDGYVYLGKSSGGIDVYDISDPVAPLPAFSIPNSGGTAWDLKYKEGHIYLATNSNGLYVYKQEGNSATEMANFPNTGNGQSFGVCLQDTLVLLTGLVNGVAVLHYEGSGTVGMTEMRASEQIKVYPNPAKDFVCIEPLNGMPGRVEILDMQGNIRGSSILQEMPAKFRLEGFPPGQYMLRFSTSTAYLTEKLLILR